MAAPPGSSALKSRTGSTSMKRRSSRGSALPLSRTRQEKLANCPARTSSRVSASMFIGRAAIVELQAARPHALETERNDLHHAAQARIVGQHADQRPRPVNWPMVRATSSVGREQKAVLLEESAAARLPHGSEHGCRPERRCVKRIGRPLGAAPASAPARPPGSGCAWGKAVSNAISRRRQGAAGEISWLMSVVMAKFRTV